MSGAATTIYKKKTGVLAVDSDRQKLLWTPSEPRNASPSLTIAINDISNLQQTPAGNPKVALKVVVQPSGAATPDNHVFSFSSASAARAEQEAITDILRNAIAALKNPQAQAALPAAAAAAAAAAPRKDDKGHSAAMAIAQAVSSGPAKANDGWYDDARLMSDIELQRSLLDANPSLRQRLNEGVKDRPETITITQFSTQFWSTRLHLLRAHAIEKAQAQGDYNVLPEIKFKRISATKEGEADRLVLNLAKEQVKLIFKQYPIVREAYNDNVPKIDQNAFWSRFFSSRLLKRLKGEKITDADPADPIFDKYLDYREKGPLSLLHVPNFIDLEGNEQDHSQRTGNRPDETMRPATFDKTPILRVLNNLSEKMMAQVAPSDGDPHAPIGLDEETYNQVQLRDLQAETNDNRVKLNIKEQQHLLAQEHDDDVSAEAELYAQHSPDQVLRTLRSELAPSGPDSFGIGRVSLDAAIGVQSDSDDSDGEEGASNAAATNGKSVRIGGRAALARASRDILASISARRAMASDDSTTTLGLSQTTFDTLVMTHNTTIEFLHYFWTLFLSGDGNRSAELAKLVDTLDKSMDRLAAVSATAEEEKVRAEAGLRQQMQGLKERSAKRQKLVHGIETLGGGRQAVEGIVAPTLKALARATSQYRKAFEEQSAAAAVAAAVVPAV